MVQPTGKIDRALWARAGWRGVTFLVDGVPVPILCLYFEDREAAFEIFDQWRKAIAIDNQVIPDDWRDLVRVVLVEEIPPGEGPPGHAVGLIDRDGERWLRLLPDPDGLRAFKEALDRAGQFLLAPGHRVGEWFGVEQHHGLMKHDLELRLPEEKVPADDPAWVPAIEKYPPRPDYD